MESSEDDDDFPSIESIIPQSKIDSLHQSLTEKGIRKLCCELLDLKDAVENLCGDMRTKYLAFLRISEEAVEMEHELIELRKHISAQGILVRDLMTGVCHELDEWNKTEISSDETQENLQDLDLPNKACDAEYTFLEMIDTLLGEHKVDEAMAAMEAEEKNNLVVKALGNTSSNELSFKSAFMERKIILENQLLAVTKQPSLSVSEMKKALHGLIKLGKGLSAHQLLLEFYGSRLQRNIMAFLPSCFVCPKTFPATLSRLVFSSISAAAKVSDEIFGDNPVYSNKFVQWAESEIENLVRLVKENASSSETESALRAACICIQDSLNYAIMLESQGLNVSKLLLVLLQPYIEEVLELNFRRARRAIFDLSELDEGSPLFSHIVSELSVFAIASNNVVAETGIRFMLIVGGMLEQLTPLVVLHFGESILTRIYQLYEKYMDVLIKALPGHMDDDSILELKEAVISRAETDSEQLALLGVAFTIADELLPASVAKIWIVNPETSEKNEGGTAHANNTPELKDWKRQVLRAFDKLKDHFCLQYVLRFIYSREGKTRLNAQIYLEDVGWDSDPLPSLPFQALFAKLQQLATVAGDVLLGKEKLQKLLLARLTETVVIWLSDVQEFWVVFEDESVPIQPIGLMQLVLDMNFTVEIARFAGYPSRQVQHRASMVIARAIQIFSARGIDTKGALPANEWFVETAKSAINSLMGASGSEASDIDDEHIIPLGGDGSELDDTSSLSTDESYDSFASASMAELESPVFTDTEA